MKDPVIQKVADAIVAHLVADLLDGTLDRDGIEQLAYWVHYAHQLRAEQHHTGNGATR